MKLAIVKNNIDLLRIIPNMTDNSVDFKIALMGNEYNVEYWKRGFPIFEKYEAKNEISYHSSHSKKNKFTQGVIHSKKISREGINYKYSFRHIIDMDLDSEFPIPLLKLVYNNSFVKPYKKKKNHKVLFLEEDNTVEIYFVSKKYDLKVFSEKWSFMETLWNSTTIDYVTEGVKISKYFLNKLEGKGTSRFKCLIDFDDFKLICKFYFSDENSNKLCFYENHDYLQMLANTPICLADDETKRIKTKAASAFAFDLDYQLSQGEDLNKLKEYEKLFALSYKRIRKENNKIFVFPQISGKLSNAN